MKISKAPDRLTDAFLPGRSGALCTPAPSISRAVKPPSFRVRENARPDRRHRSAVLLLANWTTVVGRYETRITGRRTAWTNEPMNALDFRDARISRIVDFSPPKKGNVLFSPRRNKTVRTTRAHYFVRRYDGASCIYIYISYRNASRRPVFFRA